MANLKYARVKLKTGRTFFAIVERKNRRFTLYLPVNKEGRDKSHWSSKKKAYIIQKELVENTLIVSEKPFIMSLLYDWLVPATAKNKKVNADMIAEHRRKS